MKGMECLLLQLIQPVLIDQLSAAIAREGTLL
jgi:hypothetical protein